MKNMIYLMSFVMAFFSLNGAAIELEETFPQVDVQLSTSDTKLNNSYVSVFFVNGRSPGISFGNKSQIFVRRVLSVRTKKVTSLNSVTEFDSLSNVLDGVFGSYNYLIVVLHKQARFFWRNVGVKDPIVLPADFSGPEPKASETEFLTVIRVSRVELENFAEDNPGQSYVVEVK